MNSMIVSRRWRSAGLALALLALASCGGGGSEESTAPAGSKLFVSDGGNHAIASIINAAPTVNSTFTVDRVISGGATGLGFGGTPSPSSIPSIALDAANDRLFASTQLSVSVFDNASTANGNVPFSRRITATVNTGSAGLRGVSFLNLSLDTTADILYSSDPAGEVHVFNNASTRNGAITPDRTVTPDLGATIVVLTFGIAIDKTRDMLYVGVAPQGAAAFIMVFNGASTANTNTIPNNSRAPDRVITLAGAGSFHLDEVSNRLYVSTFNGQVLTFDSASTLSGTPAANRTINLAIAPRFQIQHFIFVDTSRNKLYAVGNEATPNTSIIWVIDNASTANDNGGPASTGVGIEITSTDMRLSAVAVKP